MRFTTLRRWVHELFKFRFGWAKRRPVRTRSRRPTLQAEPLVGREPVGLLWGSMLAGAALPLVFDGGEERQGAARVGDVLNTRSLRLVEAAEEDGAERAGGGHGASEGPGRAGPGGDRTDERAEIAAVPGEENDPGNAGGVEQRGSGADEPAAAAGGSEGGGGGSTGGGTSSGTAAGGDAGQGGGAARAAQPAGAPAASGGAGNSSLPQNSATASVPGTQPAGSPAASSEATTSAGATSTVHTLHLGAANGTTMPTQAGQAAMGTTSSGSNGQMAAVTPVSVANSAGAASHNPAWAGQPRSAGGVVTAQGTFIDPPEGTALTDAVMATFSDSDPFAQVSNFQAEITWGDGQSSAGLVAAAVSGGFEVKGTHTYVEEGTYHPSVQIKDVVSGKTTTASSSIVVDEAALTVNGSTVSAIAGQAFTGVVGSYGPAEPNDPPHVTIDWGDGSAPTPGTVSQTSIVGSHTYAATAATFTITITATEANGTTATATSTANLMVPSVQGVGLSITPQQGVPFSGAVGWIDLPPGTDPGSVTVTIYWGEADQGSSPGVLRPDGHGGYEIDGTHTYAEKGGHGVGIWLSSSGTYLTSFAGSAEVLGAALVGALLPIQADEYVQFSGVVATFQSPGPRAVASDFRALIDWGDGYQTEGTVTAAAAGGFSVSASYTYAEEGTFPITVRVQQLPSDMGGGWLVLNGTTMVGDTLVVQEVQFLGFQQGTPFIGEVGYINEGRFDASSEFTATINWGDGFITPGVVIGPEDYDPYIYTVAPNTPRGMFNVYGSHTYDAPGNYSITLTVTDQDGASQTVAEAITVSPYQPLRANPYLSITTQSITAQEGQVFNGQVATVTDNAPGDDLTILLPLGLGLPPDWSASIDWGDLTGTASLLTPNGATMTVSPDGVVSVHGTHTYAKEGTYQVKVYVWDSNDTYWVGNSQYHYGPAVASAPLTVNDTIDPPRCGRHPARKQCPSARLCRCPPGQPGAGFLHLRRPDRARLVHGHHRLGRWNGGGRPGQHRQWGHQCRRWSYLPLWRQLPVDRYPDAPPQLQRHGRHRQLGEHDHHGGSGGRDADRQRGERPEWDRGPGAEFRCPCQFHRFVPGSGGWLDGGGQLGRWHAGPGPDWRRGWRLPGGRQSHLCASRPVHRMGAGS
jgi:PKD repeat protein